jgi:hypothetical protein
MCCARGSSLASRFIQCSGRFIKVASRLWVRGIPIPWAGSCARMCAPPSYCPSCARGGQPPVPFVPVPTGQRCRSPNRILLECYRMTPNEAMRRLCSLVRRVRGRSAVFPYDGAAMQAPGGKQPALPRLPWRWRRAMSSGPRTRLRRPARRRAAPPAQPPAQSERPPGLPGCPADRASRCRGGVGYRAVGMPRWRNGACEAMVYTPEESASLPKERQGPVPGAYVPVDRQGGADQGRRN